MDKTRSMTHRTSHILRRIVSGVVFPRKINFWPNCNIETCIRRRRVKGQPTSAKAFSLLLASSLTTNFSPTAAEMRAKRSKRYRKIMSAYQMAFSFREPYQVLLDSSFLKTCHSFHMPLQRYLENTLHGQCRLFVTNCTLAKIMAEFEKEKERKSKASGVPPRKGGRPEFLPPPLDLPMRHCKHKNNEGEDIGVVSEARCLLDLLAGQPHGNELAKNKQHYILATADADEKEQKRKGFLDVRERARMIPGVPVVYVKRSVMILEELSGVSDRSRNKAEREKFSEGLVDTRKRKRGETTEGEGEDDELAELDPRPQQGSSSRGMAKARGPNPLSVRKKKKVKVNSDEHDRGEQEIAQEEGAAKKRTRRGKRGRGASDSATGAGDSIEDTGSHKVQSAVDVEK